MTDKQSLARLKEAVHEFYSKEGHILKNDLHVRCLGGRLLRYIEAINDDWEVYLDYNYQYQTAYKTSAEFDTISLFPLEEVEVPTTETKIRLYPQICIRQDNKNFLALELHKSTARLPAKLAVDKVKALTDRTSPLHYQYGICVLLVTGKDYQASTTIQVHKVNEYVVTFDFN